MRWRRQIERRRVPGRARHGDQLGEPLRERIEVRTAALLHLLAVLRIDRLQVCAAADRGGTVRQRGRGILKAAHHHTDLRALGEGHHVGPVGLSIGVDEPEAGVPRQRAAQAEAGLHLIEDQRRAMLTCRQTKPAVEARGRVSVTSLALHRFDDDAASSLGLQGVVYRSQRARFGAQQGIVAADESIEFSGRRCLAPPLRVFGFGPRLAPNGKGHVVHFVPSQLVGRALGGVVAGHQRQERAPVEAAFEGDDAATIGRARVTQRERLLVGFGP